jgi:taurine dioxygenase
MIGAELCGVDLSYDLDSATIEEIRSALLQHLVLIFRDQDLSPAQQAAFARRFGVLQRHSHVRGLAEQPEIIEIRKEPEHVQNFGGVWHSDNSYLPCPPLGAILHAIEIPDAGGDTVWADQYAAYSALPEEMKRQIASLVAVHSPAPAFGVMQRLDHDPDEIEHPLVRTHPETNRKALFHSGPCTIGLKDWPTADSTPLLKHLISHATQEQFTYRHRWRKGDVVFWDNRCTMHIAMNDYDGSRRIVRRVSIGGDEPR